MFALLPALATAVASEFITDETILKWVGFAGSIVAKGFQVDDRLGGLTMHIEQMVAEERNPTTEEWGMLQARSDVAHETIQSWRIGA